MKFKHLFLLLSVFAIIVMTCTPAFAGPWDAIKGWVSGNLIDTLIVAVFAVVGGLWGGSKLGKRVLMAKVPVQRAKTLLVLVHEAGEEDSPGGKEKTPEEMRQIMRAVEDFIASVIRVFGGK